MVQETSLLALEQVNVAKAQLEVYYALKNLEIANNSIIAKKLGWSINRVTPRVLELRRRNVIIEDSKRICPITKKLTIFWRINNE